MIDEIEKEASEWGHDHHGNDNSMKESPSCSRINKMDQQRVEEKNEKEEQSEESESVTDRSEEEMSDMMMHVAFEGGKESAKTYDPYL